MADIWPESKYKSTPNGGGSKVVMLLNITDKNEWRFFTEQVADYNIYQTFEWGEFKKGQGWNAKRFLVKIDNNDFTLAQVLEKKYFNRILAWIPGGPLYPKNSPLKSYESFLQEITGFYSKQKFYLRINQQYRSNPIVNFLLEKYGFKRSNYNNTSGFTIYVTLDNFKEKMTKNWRRNYNRSHKNNLKFIVCNDELYFPEILKLYDDTVAIKKFKKAPIFSHIFELHKYFKENVISFLVKHDGIPVSGRVILRYKDKAFDYIAGTSLMGRKIYASHFLVYNMLEWCLKNGINIFDFSGVSPQDNGVFNFKNGAGGELIEFVGEWEISNSLLLENLFNFYIAFAKRM